MHTLINVENKDESGSAETVKINSLRMQKQKYHMRRSKT